MTSPMTKPTARSRPASLISILLAGVLTMSAVGCSGIYPSAPPQVSLVDLRFTDVTVFETSGLMVLRLANENPDPMLIDGGVYNLYINGVRVGQGLSDASFEVPRLSSEVDEVPFRVNNLAFATRLKGIIDSGSFDYLIKAKVYVEGGFGRKTLKVEKGGFFDFEEARRSSS